MTKEKISIDQAYDFFKQLAVEGVRPEHVDRVQKNKTLRKQVAQVIINGETSDKVFPLWKTIKLGTDFATADEFRGALKQGGFLTSDWANGLLRQPAFARSISPVPVEVELCMATTAELTGKAAGGTTAEVFAGIKRAGGDLCPAEVGPQLRVQYKDQPKGEWLFIAMEPITDSDGDPHVFCVERYGDDFWLYSHRGHPEDFWHGYNRWVFVRRSPR